ncbi:hypothetical protein BC477_14500 [Clavibacter michiganensis subsp. michiganensis]|nr:hypothetical protein BC477_14500 [Clavibacter michiganensis subsp. michiganensis]
MSVAAKRQLATKKNAAMLSHAIADARPERNTIQLASTVTRSTAVEAGRMRFTRLR